MNVMVELLYYRTPDGAVHPFDLFIGQWEAGPIPAIEGSGVSGAL